MKNSDFHAKDFKLGDLVYVPEVFFLNQKKEPYKHEAWENIEMIQVKVIRTVFKKIVNDPYRPFLTSGGKKFRQVFHTFSEAVDCLILHPYLMEKFRVEAAIKFADHNFNVTNPDVVECFFDAKEMEMMR